MKAQETYGEVDWALAGEPNAWTGDGMDVNLDLDSHGLRHLDQQLSLINSKPNNSFQVIVTRHMNVRHVKMIILVDFFVHNLVRVGRCHPLRNEKEGWKNG